MPNGRLAKDIIAARKPKEVYVNTSGNAASVSLFANTISTTANTELSVVVGIASTELQALTTQVTQSAGTFCSMTAPLYAYDQYSEAYHTNFTGSNSGVAKTFYGIQKLPSCPIDGDVNTCYDGNYVDANYANNLTDSYGCTMTRINTTGTGNGGVCSFACNCIGVGLCVNQMFGGNEMQNPSIWMRQLPPSCNCCGYFWGGKVVGFQYNMCCACCWERNSATYGTFGTWWSINGVNVGMGASANAALNATAIQTNWCCCYGNIGANKMPINVYSGCPSCYQNDAACFGNVCNYQYCKQMANCCCMGAGYKMWNWYAQDNEFMCCCVDFTGGENQCWRELRPNTVVSTSSIPCQCYNQIAEGELRTPLWLQWYWCCGQSQGCFRTGYIISCWTVNNAACGCNFFCKWVNQAMETGASNLCRWYDMWQNRYCHPCCTGNFMVNQHCSNFSPNPTCKISPFGFIYGMTNCSFATWLCTVDDGENNRLWRYMYSYPAYRYGNFCAGHSPCYYFFQNQIQIQDPNGTGNGQVSYESPIKYWAWNCMGITNKHGTCGCTYVMVRSGDPKQCGIFTFDAHDARVQQGPFCYCSTAAYMCCGTWEPMGCLCLGDTTACTCGWTKIADWPKAMDCSSYLDGQKYMCFTCLYRADLCNWTISIWNNKTYQWAGFESSDLTNWTLISDPYSRKVSDVLTTTVTADYACIVDDCNCYFANINCSGIIDYKLSVGQYERTGIVLSDGDRIMVNNNGDVETSFQVWGYEG